MSSDPPSGGPSPAPSAPDPDLELARIVRGRGSALVEALEAWIPGGAEHADATAAYAFAVAVELGHGRGRAELIRETARLHEIGEVYEGDPHAGAQLARGAGIPEIACQWLAAVGERFDGTGQAGLGGERIPLEARIMRAACACARGGADTETLASAAGYELDPRVVEALASVLSRAIR